MESGSKSVFFFGKNTVAKKAFIHLRKAPTNIILTLTDLRFKVIFSCSSGSVEGNKKFRRSTYVMEPLFAKVLAYLRYHDITFVDLLLRMRLGSHTFSFIKECSFHGLTVVRILTRNFLPHNGVRARKRPRK